MTQEAKIQKITNWIQSQDDFLGALLVGSYARENPKPHSDIDLVILSHKINDRLNDLSWITFFSQVDHYIREDWGELQSIRVFYKDQTEIEFGLTTKKWAHPSPIDVGTQKVIQNGFKILHDPENILFTLCSNSECFRK